MGCVLSSNPQTQPQRRHRQINSFPFYDETPPPVSAESQQIQPNQQIQCDLATIIQGLGKVFAPDNVTPVVCLSESSIPVFLSHFAFDEQAEAIELPIVALSRKNAGKFLYLGSVDFLSHSTFRHTETAAFIENIITWGADFRAQSVRIMLLGFPNSIASTLQSDLSSYGYIVDIPKETPKTISASLVFIASNYDCDEQIIEPLMNYISTGGTVAIFAQKDTEYPINRIFEESGLAFAACSLKQVVNNIDVLAYNELSEFTLESISHRYTDILEAASSLDDVDLSVLDDAVSKLRYYISEMGTQNYDDAEYLISKSLDFLSKTNYETDGAICPHVVHSVVAVIITEAIPRLNPERVTPAPFISYFPGESGKKIELGTIKLRITVKADRWNSTNIWMPAGVLSEITVDKSCIVQIGSHINCLLDKPGPWHRWPNITNRFSLIQNNPTRLATPYGGILYLLSDTTVSVNVSFSHVLRYPLFMFNQTREVYEKTRNNDVPWGEIMTSYSILTLPSKKILEIEENSNRTLEEYCSLLDNFIENIYHFIGSKVTEPRRVVFDVDVPIEEPTMSDTIILNWDIVDSVIHMNKVDSELLTFFSGFALSILQHEFFDHEVEIIISNLAVCHAINTIWPTFTDDSISILGYNAPKIFFDLWDIYTEKGPAPFMSSLQALILYKEKASSQEAWNFFIQKMSVACETKLRHLMDRFGQGGLLSTTSSLKLQSYQLDENDI